MIFRFDSQSLETLIASYPDSIRDAVLWLGNYVREKCSSNFDVLEAQTKKLGFSTVATTYSRVLRGLWNKNADGEQVPPIISEKNLMQVVEKLRQEDRIATMAGKVPFILTSTWFAIFDYIDAKRAPEQVCKFGLIIGPTGSQKTACTKQYELLNNHGAVKHLEAPYTANMGEFITDLAAAYGISPNAAREAKMRRIRESVNSRRCIIIDNIQRLYKEKAGWIQPVFSFLQKLQDDTGCTIIMCAVPAFEMTLSQGIDRGYFEQFEGRCGGQSEFLVLSEFASREDVLAIANAFQLKDAEKHAAALEEISRRRGRIRILFNALQKGKRLADVNSRPLSMKYVRMALAEAEESEAN